MEIAYGIFLGIVQGATEFIPVSSSGHLILAREIFGLSVMPSDLAFDAVLQLASAMALIVYFRKEITSLVKTAWSYIRGATTESKDKIILSALVLGTIPAVLIGLVLEEKMETVFRSGYLVAYMLIFGSILMFLADRFGKKDKEITAGRGFIVGLFQALALLPGVSRSGSTISGGLFLGLDRVNAARFGFLLAIPIILGSGLKKLFDISASGEILAFGPALFAGSLAAFVVGLLSVYFLLKYLKNHSLTPFIIYRVVLAILILNFV